MAVRKKISELDSNREKVADEYRAAGWNVVTGKEHLIAGRDKRLHFVKIAPNESTEASSEMIKNNFIQNAFSNDAIPVYARVVGSKITYEDANLRTRILIRKKRAPKTQPEEQRAKVEGEVEITESDSEVSRRKSKK